MDQTGEIIILVLAIGAIAYWIFWLYRQISRKNKKVIFRNTEIEKNLEKISGLLTRITNLEDEKMYLLRQFRFLEGLTTKEVLINLIEMSKHLNVSIFDELERQVDQYFIDEIAKARRLSFIAECLLELRKIDDDFHPQYLEFYGSLEHGLVMAGPEKLGDMMAEAIIYSARNYNDPNKKFSNFHGKIEAETMVVTVVRHQSYTEKFLAEISLKILTERDHLDEDQILLAEAELVRIKRNF